MARLHIPDYCAALNHIGFWSAPILYLDFRLGFLAAKARGKISYRGQATAFESVWKLLTILMELRRTCKLPIFSIIWETVLINDTTGLQLSIAGRKWQFCGEFPLLVGMTRGREWCACVNQSCCCWRGWDPPDSTLTHLFMHTPTPSHPQSLAPNKPTARICQHFHLRFCISDTFAKMWIGPVHCREEIFFGNPSHDDQGNSRETRERGDFASRGQRDCPGAIFFCNHISSWIEDWGG